MIHCLLKTPDPKSHILDIQLEIQNIDQDVTCIFLPLWRPGRYERADFAKNIMGLRVTDENKNDLEIRRIQSHRWEIATKQIDCIKIEYRYYAYKMDAGNSFVDETQIYLNFISCILLSIEHMDEPLALRVDVPDHYTVVCPLQSTSAGMIQANNYHELVDSPFLASDNIKTLNYDIQNAKFHIHINGQFPLEEERIISDFKKFSQNQIEVMNGFPTDCYHFMVQSLDYKHYHGVEHQNSTVLVLGPNDGDSSDYWNKLVGVASHELFHTWNVTRIRPMEMSPYQYHSEIQFSTGFVAEGFTTYFGDLFLITSGVFTLDQYLKEVSNLCNRHFNNFGRHRSSLIASSEQLWVDGYQNTHPSRKVSIYVKGALVSLILDLEIRKATQNAFQLLDVVKSLYQDFTFDKGGYAWSDVKNILRKIGGEHIYELATLLVETTRPIEQLLDEALSFVGCEMVKRKYSSPFCATTGLIMSDSKVIDIHPDTQDISPFSIGDEIIAADRIAFKSDMPTHDIKVITIKRGDSVIDVDFPFTEQVHLNEYHIQVSDSISDHQLANRALWLGK